MAREAGEDFLKRLALFLIKIKIAPRYFELYICSEMNPTGRDYTSPYGYQYFTLLDTLWRIRHTPPPPAFTHFSAPPKTQV